MKRLLIVLLGLAAGASIANQPEPVNAKGWTFAAIQAYCRTQQNPKDCVWRLSSGLPYFDQPKQPSPWGF